MAKKIKTKKSSPALAARKPGGGPRSKLSITIDPAILSEVDARQDLAWGKERSTIISRDLARYYSLLAEARARLREQLTPAEMSLILDVQNGHLYAPQIHGAEIWANVEDACRLDSAAEKWGVDGAALIPKLQALDMPAIHALVDACERFWAGVGTPEEIALARALD